MKKMKINGESRDVREETIDFWKERIPELLQEYSSENIWSLDETACFWRALPEDGLAEQRWQKRKTVDDNLLDCNNSYCRWREGSCHQRLEI